MGPTRRLWPKRAGLALASTLLSLLSLLLAEGAMRLLAEGAMRLLAEGAMRLLGVGDPILRG